MTRNVECVDQLGIIYPICDNHYTEHCCEFNQYFFNGQPLWYKTCNQHGCTSGEI